MALILNWQRGGGTQLAYASRTVSTPHRPLHPPHEESRSLYKMRTCSQESVMRNKGDRILIFSSCIVSKTVINWHR